METSNIIEASKQMPGTWEGTQAEWEFLSQQRQHIIPLGLPGGGLYIFKAVGLQRHQIATNTDVLNAIQAIKKDFPEISFSAARIVLAAMLDGLEAFKKVPN